MKYSGVPSRLPGSRKTDLRHGPERMHALHLHADLILGVCLSPSSLKKLKVLYFFFPFVAATLVVECL